MPSAHVLEVLGSVAANVRRLRLQRGLTQERLAEAAELDLSYVQRVERASVNASLAVLAALAFALGVRPAKLLAHAKAPVVKRGRPRTAKSERRPR
jgi:transcriptional regulator with XRE-family HTH domain